MWTRVLCSSVVLALAWIALSCDRGDDSEHDFTVAWATIGREITSEIRSAYLAGEIHNDSARGLFATIADPDQRGDLFGLSAQDVLSIICEESEPVFADKPELSREVASLCDGVGAAVELDPIRARLGGTAAGEVFDSADRAWVAAGASETPLPTEERSKVLYVILARLFAPYLEGTAGGLEPPQTRRALSYICPSLLGTGNASITSCRELMDALSYSVGDHLDYAKPADVKPVMERMLSALSSGDS
jgi:hypothetical protein